MTGPFVVDGWRAEPALNTFTRGDRTVRVEPKVMELCVRLADAPGTVLSKAELLETVWPDTVVGEDALTRAVSELRRALDDDARNPRIIQTIPKRGYRLIGAVQAADRPANGAELEPPIHGRPSKWRRAFLAAGGGMLVLATVWLLMLRPQPGPGAAPSASPEPPVWILATEFECETDAPPEVAEFLQRVVEEALTRDGNRAIVPTQRVADTLSRMRRRESAITSLETALEVATRDGEVAAILTGRLQRAGEDLVLTAQLVEPGGRTVKTLVTRGTNERALIAATDDEAAALPRGLSLARPSSTQPLPAVTTSSLTALRFFSQAMALADSVMATIEAPWTDVATLLHKALDEDAEFVMARVWLAYALRSSDLALLSSMRDAPPSPNLFRRYATESLDQAASVSDRERLFITGMAHALLDEPDNAIPSLEALLWRDSRFLEVRTRALLAGLYAGEARWADHRDQVLRLADLLPHDFDMVASAAEALVLQDGDTRRAAPYIERASRLIVPSIAQRDNSSWLVAWLEHLPVYERWASGQLAAAVEMQRALDATLPARVLEDRDAMATASGYVWLSLGRLTEARHAFDAVGHQNQRLFNLAFMAELLDDRRAAVDYLTRHGWAYNPLPFARMGLFDRARDIIAARSALGAHGEARRSLARGEEALATGRVSDAIRLLQNGIDRVRARPHHEFYNASLSLARAWHAAGDSIQALRVLEEAARERPPYVTPGLAAAWWIKVRVHLVRAYRQAGRPHDADVLEQQVRTELSEAGPDHPFLQQLAADRTRERSHDDTSDAR